MMIVTLIASQYPLIYERNAFVSFICHFFGTIEKPFMNMNAPKKFGNV
jgi:hypothetical protein